jgi:hypothetical protein
MCTADCIISTVAGNGTSGSSGDGFAATNAMLTFPQGIALDANATYLYITDPDAQRVRKVTLSGALAGTIATAAGSGVSSFSGDGGAATAATLKNPSGVAVDSAGNLFIADTRNSRIRRVDAVSGNISTYAGTGSGSFGGDNGPATSAAINEPYDLALDSAGNLFIADTKNHRIRKVDAVSGNITTFAGNGTYDRTGDGGQATSAAVAKPYGVAVDAAGNVYLSDPDYYSTVRMVNATTGIITLFAGTGDQGFSGDGGYATSAKMDNPDFLAADAAGNIYIANGGVNRIRRVKAGSHIISTFAGNGTYGFGGDGGPATSASLKYCQGVAVDRTTGNIYISDANNYRIRKVVVPV